MTTFSWPVGDCINGVPLYLASLLSQKNNANPLGRSREFISDCLMWFAVSLTGLTLGRKFMGVCSGLKIFTINFSFHTLCIFNLVYYEFSFKVSSLLEEIDLADQQDTLSKDLSGGQKRKLCVGLALIGDPKVRISCYSVQAWVRIIVCKWKVLNSKVAAWCLLVLRSELNWKRCAFWFWLTDFQWWPGMKWEKIEYGENKTKNHFFGLRLTKLHTQLINWNKHHSISNFRS